MNKLKIRLSNLALIYFSKLSGFGLLESSLFTTKIKNNTEIDLK